MKFKRILVLAQMQKVTQGTAKYCGSYRFAFVITKLKQGKESLNVYFFVFICFNS